MRLVSVIVRSTNRTYLKDAIESISRQDYNNIEVIIVDASGTGEIINRKFETKIKIEVVCTGNPLTRSEAANIGIISANGDEIIFLDEDDMFYDSHISKLVRARSEHPNMLAAYTDVEVDKNDLIRIFIYDREWSISRIFLSNYLPINAVLFSRKILDFGCIFDENILILEDWDWWLQVAQHTSFKHVSGVSAYYRYELGESKHSQQYKQWRSILYRKWIGLLGIDRFIEETFVWAQDADLIRNNNYLLIDETKQRDTHIDSLQNRINSLEEERNSLLQSRSWRITRPLRNVIRATRLIVNLSRQINRQTLRRGLQLAHQGNWRGLQHRIIKTLNAEPTQKKVTGSPNQILSYNWSMISDCIIDDNKNRFQFEPHHQVTIVVPVYNGFEHLDKFFDSLFQNTTEPYVLIVIDDASPDKRVFPTLQQQQNRFPKMSLLTNSENLGFVRSVNRGMQATKNNVVLLNTDTIVPSFWIERLLEPLHNEKIASVTPFTNSGTICSFPLMLEDNGPIYGLSVESIDKAFKRLQYNPISIPTGVGFCMAISHEAINKVGYFDADAFGRGYGEENDWCMRATNLGYHHVLCPNLFVYHAHGGSFLPNEKQVLLSSNLKILDKRYPNYGNLVNTYIHKNPAHFYREAARISLMLRPENRPALVIDHDNGGGANHFRNRFIKSCLDDSRAVCVYLDDYLLGTRKIICYAENDILSITISNLEEFSDFINKFSFEEIYYNSLVYASDPLEIVDLLLVFSKKAKIIVNIHDFYPICPSYSLLNYQDNFCGIPADIDKCKSCIQRHHSIFPNSSRDIILWRNHWGRLLERAHLIRCFSVDSANHLKRAYPECSKNIYVTQHDTSYFKKMPLSLAFDNSLHIGIIGSINKQKGAKILQEFSSYVEKNKLPCKITLIGEIDPDYKLPDIVTVTGRYNSGNLPKIIIESGIQIIWLPFIWPETFSYVTAECMAMDLPIATFDIGAPAERLKIYNKSLIHKSKLPKDLYIDFLKFRNELSDLQSVPF